MQTFTVAPNMLQTFMRMPGGAWRGDHRQHTPPRGPPPMDPFAGGPPVPSVVRRLAQYKALQRQFHRVMGGGTAMVALQQLK